MKTRLLLVGMLAATLVLPVRAQDIINSAVSGLSGLGTGVATMLGIAVGSAGGPVVNGGALGTPSSGVATNLTGTASGLTAGTVTTNANLTGDVTSVGNAATLAAGSASNLNSGTLAAARGGAGTINGALKGNGSGVVSQAACADLSNATGACSATYNSATSWTPADGSGASLTFTSVSASYKRIGDMVYVSAQWTYPSTADGTAAKIQGLPVTVFNANYAKAPCSVTLGNLTTTPAQMVFAPNTATATFNTTNANVAITNATLSGSFIVLGCWYPAA